jgi:RHH-type proline utilization regulon transcriptional repressor/proline dehydrogenase/delta 1-pyrroline-5-carboxylate dehydrogenase
MNSPSFVVGDGAQLETPVGEAINHLFLAPEADVVHELADSARLERHAREAVQQRALALVEQVRSEKPASGSGIDAFLREYHLGSREGVILMCLAEALLRIPDAETADKLIADILATAIRCS